MESSQNTGNEQYLSSSFLEVYVGIQYHSLFVQYLFARFFKKLAGKLIAYLVFLSLNTVTSQRHCLTRLGLEVVWKSSVAKL